MRLAWLSALLLLSFSYGCSSDDARVDADRIQSVNLEGHALIGAPSQARSLGPEPSDEIQGQLLLIARSPEGSTNPGCPTETQHRASIQFRPDPAGKFAIMVPAESFAPVSHPGCPLAKLVSAKINVLRLSAILNANPARCQSLCPGNGSGSCQDECEQTGKIRATARLESPDLQPLNLVFSEISPALSGDDAPDLRVNSDAARSSWAIEEREFDATSCAVQEGCLSGAGRRRLLTFDSSIANAGNAALFIGPPSRSSDAHFDACHAHYHLGNIMTYELVDATGQTVAQGRKQGFCLMDSEPTGPGGSGIFTCDHQGISPGWSDVYDRSLDCQWVDITDVPAGDYLLRLTVNPEFVFSESDHSNNSVDIPVKISESASGQGAILR